MDSVPSSTDPIHTALHSWEELNGLLKEVISRRDWTEVEPILERKSECQRVLEELLPPSHALTPDQRRHLRAVLDQESAMGPEFQQAVVALEAERQQSNAMLKQSHQLRRSYGTPAPSPIFWEHFT
jgi:hypothetical protein